VVPVAHQGNATKHPLGRGPPRSRDRRPLRRGPPRSKARRILERGPPRSRTPACTCSRTRVRAFNALTPQGRATTLTRLGITPRRCSANSRGEAIPAAVQHCAEGRCQLRDTVPPTPVRLTRRALEGGPAAPLNIFHELMQEQAVTSGRWDQSSPSLSTLCDRPRHCGTTPDTVTTSQRCWDARGRDIATTATVPRTGPRQRRPRTGPLRRPVNQPLHRHPRSRSCTSTRRTTTPQQERDSPGRPSALQHCSPYPHT
jgi:hypothetical protein